MVEVISNVKTHPRPTDRYLIVYLIVLFHGMGCLLPWNMFINAKEYYENYKLHPNYTHLNSTNLGNSFLPVLGLVSQAPTVAFNWINIFAQFGEHFTSTRIAYAIPVEIIVVIITIVLVLLNTSTWSMWFYIITMISVFILNVASGIYQNTMYGIVSKLPSAYTGAIILGNNISGIFTAVMNMITKTFGHSVTQMAVLYFLIALVVLIICFVLYFFLLKIEFYKFHNEHFKTAQQMYGLIDCDGLNENKPITKVPYWKIFRSCADQCFNAFYIFFITLALFPVVLSNVIKSSDDFFISDMYYHDIMCFLSFSLFAALGNLLSAKIMWPGPKKLYIPVLIRTVFIPLLLFCNFRMVEYHDNRAGKDVLKMRRFNPRFGDYVFGIIGILFSFSGGYYSSLALSYCGKSVALEHSSIAGMFGGACLVTGVFAGVLLSSTWSCTVFL